MSYVDAGYAIALGTLFVYAISLVLRRRRWERALRMSEPRRRAGERAGPRRAVVTGTTTEPTPPPSPPTSEVRQGPALPPPRRRRTSWRHPGRLRAPGRRPGLPARRGAGQLARLLRHRQPGLRPPAHAGHADLPPGGHGGAGHHPRHGRRLGLHHLPGIRMSSTSPTPGARPGSSRPGIPVVVVGHFTSVHVERLRLEHHPGQALAAPTRAQYPNRVKATPAGPVC